MIVFVWPCGLEGLWLSYAMQQNLIPSFHWIAPSCHPPWHNPRKGRDPMLPSGNLVDDRVERRRDAQGHMAVRDLTGEKMKLIQIWLIRQNLPMSLSILLKLIFLKHISKKYHFIVQRRAIKWT